MADDQLAVMKLSTKDVINRLLKDYLLKYKRKLILSVLAMLVVALTTSMLPLIIQMITDDIFIGHDKEALIYLPIGIALIMVMKGFSEYFATTTDTYVVNRVIADIRIEIFEALAYADLKWIRGVHSGRVQSSFLHDTNIMRDSSAKIIVALGKNLLKVIVLIGNMLYLNWLLSISVLMLLPVIGYILSRQRKKMRSESHKNLIKTADTASLLSEALKAIPIIKAYRKEKSEISRIRSEIDTTFYHYWNMIKIRSAASPITEGIVGVGLGISIFIAGYQGINGSLTAGEFTGFLTAIMLVIQPLRALASLQTAMQEGVAAANRVFAIIDEMPKITQPELLKPMQIDRGDIFFKNINFTYEDNKTLFNNLNLEIKAGERTALVGASGSGKTTLFHLILQFYKPQSGDIIIDGQNVVEYDVYSLRKHCALVTQSPVLFDTTIKENIIYGKEDATDQEILDVLEAVALKEFVDSLPEGINTSIGEAGELLSGGQKQRLTLARALLTKAKILLLDEPTSALDNITESVIQKSLEMLHGNTTVVIIAHRLSTISNADNIIVLDKGEIIEQGKHDELLASAGTYSNMFNL